MQWDSYLKACNQFSWEPLPCGVDQACKYVTFLSERLKYSSIVAYYQSVIFFHTCAGLEPVRVSDPVLRATLNGIKRLVPSREVGKEPILPQHLESMAKVVDVDVELEFIVFVAALLMFRSLLRVSHVVSSDHTLLRSDIRFNNSGFLLSVRSSKTKKRGDEINYIPVLKSDNHSICAVRWLKLLVKRFPAPMGAPLFSTLSCRKLNYSTFLKLFKVIIRRAGITGDFATHSLRAGGATYMSMLGCNVSEIKSRGQWASDCVNRYIRQPLSHKIMVEGHVAKHC